MCGPHRQRWRCLRSLLSVITSPAKGHLDGVSLETQEGPKEAAGTVRVVLACPVVTKWKAFPFVANV